MYLIWLNPMHPKRVSLKSFPFFGSASSKFAVYVFFLQFLCFFSNLCFCCRQLWIWIPPGLLKYNLHIMWCDFKQYKEVTWYAYILWIDYYFWVSQVAQWIKNPPAMQKTQEIWVWFLVSIIPWRRKWQPTPVFLPEKSHEQSSLTGYSPKDCKESAMTELLSIAHSLWV